MAKKNKKTRVKETEEVELEVEEVDTEEAKPAKPPMGMEATLAVVTTFALVWAFIVINVKLHEVSGKGWPF